LSSTPTVYAVQGTGEIDEAALGAAVAEAGYLLAGRA
jgi:hypothetical protein